MQKFASTINQMSKENEQIVAVGSRNIENAKAFANEHDIPRYYDSYEALVKDQDVEAVYVATPNILCIMRIAGRLCLEHGKHVLK
ncbi:MAG: Gfo/Idh/MocA family oxidoreductase [Lachnospira eligens]